MYAFHLSRQKYRLDCNYRKAFSIKYWFCKCWNSLDSKQVLILTCNLTKPPKPSSCWTVTVPGKQMHSMLFCNIMAKAASLWMTGNTRYLFAKYPSFIFCQLFKTVGGKKKQLLVKLSLLQLIKKASIMANLPFGLTVLSHFRSSIVGTKTYT